MKDSDDVRALRRIRNRTAAWSVGLVLGSLAISLPKFLALQADLSRADAALLASQQQALNEQQALRALQAQLLEAERKTTELEHPR